jgi:hypothetical protein
MATVIQAGTALQLLDGAGALTTLTLPAGVTLRTDVKPRWEVYQNRLVLVNTPSQPLTIDAFGIVRLLTPRPPRLTPVLSGVGVSTLTGNYRVKETFVTLDTHGNTLSESDYSPISAQVAITNQFLQAATVDTSPDTITLRRLYRTTDNGAIYFQWVDLDGNVLTSIQDNLADAGLSVFSAPTLGTPPRLTTIAEFRGRLFGSGDLDIDNLRYTQAGLPYAWPIDNLFPIPGLGSDAFGITALAARRDALGVGRKNLLSQIVGTGAETGTNIDFDTVVVSREVGIESQETVRVFRDTAYFLWKDGVYTWDASGITCISDGNATSYTRSAYGNVRSWFVTDSYFNLDMFSAAFAEIQRDRAVYRLFLVSAGSAVVDSFVDYDIQARTWWGPHKTDLFTPTSAFTRTNAANRIIPVIGSAFSVFQDQIVRTDGNPVSGTTASSETAIAFDVVSKRHAMGAPDQDKYFGELSVEGTAQAGGVLTVQTRTGELNQTRTQAQQYNMRKSRQRLGRLGKGKHAQLEFTNNNIGEPVQLLGYEIDPVTLIGRR